MGSNTSNMAHSVSHIKCKQEKEKYSITSYSKKYLHHRGNTKVLIKICYISRLQGKAIEYFEQLATLLHFSLTAQHAQ